MFCDVGSDINESEQDLLLTNECYNCLFALKWSKCLWVKGNEQWLENWPDSNYRFRYRAVDYKFIF